MNFKPPPLLPLPNTLTRTPSPLLQARNKPIEPPKKPAAAPFFLPTVSGANAGRNPVFDAAQGAPSALAADGEDAALAAAAAAAWGEGDDDDAEDGGVGGAQRAQQQQVAAAARSRVLKGVGVAMQSSGLVRLLRACAPGGDWASLVAYLRDLPPVQLDSEVKAMQVCAAGHVHERGFLRSAR